jgi:2-phospho-L-lactate guanylyltransferase
MLHCQILIPCKPLGEGKSRLAQLLSARQRYDLCASLLDRTLSVAKCLTQSDRIFLVTADAEAAAQACHHGVAVIIDNAHTLNGALTQGRDQLLRAGADDCQGLLILPTDLPFADEAAILKVVSASDITLACDHDRSGTNLLLLKRGAARSFTFSFGASSFARHCEIARRAGYSVTAVADSALAFDIDEPHHYLKAGSIGRLRTVEPA